MLYRIATSLTRLQKQVILMLLDLVLILPCMAIALVIQGRAVGEMDLLGLLGLLAGPMLVMFAIGTMMSLVLGLPRIQLKAYDLEAIARSALLGVGLALVGDAATRMLLPGFDLGLLMAVFWLTFIVADVTLRLTMKSLLIDAYRRGSRRQKVLIYGAGKTGMQLATALKTDDSVEVMGFIDDNPSMQNLRVAGVQVHSPLRIKRLVREHEITRVVLAMPAAPRARQARIARTLQALGLEVRALPSFASLVGSSGLADQVQPIDPDGYLRRENFDFDLRTLTDFYGSVSVMITGAGGSIGSELCRQILACKPARLVLFEVSEAALYTLLKDLGEMPEAKEIALVPVLGSVNDGPHLRRVMTEHGVSVVVHAAAYKHVPMVEENPLPGLWNNTFGTKTCADAARDSGVPHFVLVSTDKAVRPASVMGASKRLAELCLQDAATRSEATRFSIVRFGNVLGSSGSVVPLFEEQIARGGPVTVTHSGMTRYFMTASEAARLVLLSGAIAEGGEVFTLDMGEPVSIVALARTMIEAAGYRVADADAPDDGDIQIIVTGPRPGEKLHEEVCATGILAPTTHPKILRAEEERLSEIEIATALKALRAAIDGGDEVAARGVLLRWVDGYLTAGRAPHLTQPPQPLQSGTLSIPEPPQG